MDRREFLAAGAAATAAGLAGCRSMFETRSARSPPLVEDRPNAVYVPTHVEGMEMVGTASAGDYQAALTYSFPHRFWTIDIDRRNKIDIQGSDTMHLMTTVWDPETMTVVPNNAVSTTVRRDGETVVDRDLWPMLSQNMSVHAGDNVALDGDGTYEVEVDVGPVSARTTGAFRDRFTDVGSATFTLDFQRSTLEDISFERLRDRQGELGAVDPMQMEMMPVAQLPEPADMPGTHLGTAESGDARFAVLRTDVPEGVETDGDAESYVAISPRTPYNRYPLPLMALSARLTRGPDELFATSLQPTFDPDLGYHYGVPADPQDGDDLRVVVDGVPQLARHEGYEMAFLEFEDMDLTLSA
jgi:hypothetical protein